MNISRQRDFLLREITISNPNNQIKLELIGDNSYEDKEGYIWDLEDNTLVLYSGGEEYNEGEDEFETHVKSLNVKYEQKFEDGSAHYIVDKKHFNFKT